MSSSKRKIAALLDQPNWNSERKALRAILLDCQLTEEVKWGKLCYTFQGSNTCIIYGLKEYCGVGFFKGSLLKDPDQILSRQGKNSQAVRLMRFTSAEQIAETESVLKSFIREAIEIERAGLKVDFKEKNELVFPEEFTAVLSERPDVKAAFNSLTPGRQRGYNLHFSGAKQSKTRTARIEKCLDKILSGKGLNDR